MTDRSHFVGSCDSLLEDFEEEPRSPPDHHLESSSEYADLKEQPKEQLKLKCESKPIAELYNHIQQLRKRRGDVDGFDEEFNVSSVAWHWGVSASISLALQL